MNPSKIFLISGVSTGLGKALAVEALARGHQLVGTVRGLGQIAEFEALSPGRAHARMLDMRQFDAMAPLVDEITATVGPIDVLVNNAGYGHEGIMEESPLNEMRQQFDVNVFGAVALAKAAIPGMRSRRSGHVVNITSMGGFITMPGIAYYCGSKFALEGISEVMSKELAPFGVAVTAVAPGSLRTDWAGRSMVRSQRSIPDYDPLFEPVRQARQAKSGKQLGDPAKAAVAILRLVEMADPPSHLLLGSDALDLVRRKLKDMEQQIALHEALTRSTDFEPASPP